MADDDGAYMAEANDKICRVYDKEDFFTVFVQLLLAGIALGSLYIKRMQEHPRRLFRIWFLDVSKQGLGAGYAHVLNMIIATVISRNPRGGANGEGNLDDECAWYGMSYFIDTTVGLFLSVLFLQLLDRVANQRDWTSLKNSGVYTGEDGTLHWIHQVLAWLSILTIVKFIIYILIWMFSGLLASAGAWIFAPLQNNIRFELMFVMIIFPGFLNIIYFWIADSFLKAKKDQTSAHEPDSMTDKKQNLLREGAAGTAGTTNKTADSGGNNGDTSDGTGTSFNPKNWSNVSQPKTDVTPSTMV